MTLGYSTWGREILIIIVKNSLGSVLLWAFCVCVSYLCYVYCLYIGYVYMYSVHYIIIVHVCNGTRVRMHWITVQVMHATIISINKMLMIAYIGCTEVQCVRLYKQNIFCCCCFNCMADIVLWTIYILPCALTVHSIHSMGQLRVHFVTLNWCVFVQLVINCMCTTSYNK